MSASGLSTSRLGRLHDVAQAGVAVAAAYSRDDVVCFRPDHASITCVEAGNSSVRLIELGGQADTTVLSRG